MQKDLLWVGLSDESCTLWRESTTLHALSFILVDRFGQSFSSLCNFVEQLKASRSSESELRVVRRDLLEPVCVDCNDEWSSCTYATFVACVSLAVERHCLMKEQLSPQEFFGVDIAPESFEMRLRRCEEIVSRSIADLMPVLTPSHDTLRECRGLHSFCEAHAVVVRIFPNHKRDIGLNLSLFGSSVTSFADICLIAKMHEMLFSLRNETPAAKSGNAGNRTKTIEVCRGALQRVVLTPFSSRKRSSKFTSVEDQRRAKYHSRFQSALDFARDEFIPRPNREVIVPETPHLSTGSTTIPQSTCKFEKKELQSSCKLEKQELICGARFSRESSANSAAVRILHPCEAREGELCDPCDPWEIVASSKYFRRLLGFNSAPKTGGNPSRVDFVIEELSRTVQ